MKLVKVACPQCGGSVEVDKTFKIARCPFCNSSFVIEKTDQTTSSKEQSVYVTTFAECEPDDVKKELEIYSLFGWDFKERRYTKVPNGMIYYSDGTSKKKYQDMVQLTFQRNVKASWCTKELLAKEKEFFALRKEYSNDLNQYKRVISQLLEIYKDFKTDKKTLILCGVIAGVTVFFIIALLAAWTLSSNFFCGLAALLVLIIGVLGVTFVIRKSNKTDAQKKEAFSKTFYKNEDEFKETQKPRIDKMNEIAIWAGEQMEKKFGYKLIPSADLIKIETFNK